MSKETDAEDLENDKQWIRETIEILQNLGLDEDWLPTPEFATRKDGTTCCTLGNVSFETDEGLLRQKCGTCGHYWTISARATHGLCENCASSILELILPLLARYKTALDKISKVSPPLGATYYTSAVALRRWANEALKDE